MTNTAV